MADTIRQLPPDYREVRHVVLLSPGSALALNLAALLPMAVALALMAGWYAFVLNLRGPRPGGPGADWPWWLWLVIVLMVVLPLHELAHGLAITWTGHTARYGVKWSKFAPYATADGALFRRYEFIVIALAPLVGLTLLGMALMLVTPDALAYYLALGIIFNAGGAIGDLWMVAAVVRHPASALVRDEADSIRIYERGG